MPKPFYHPPLNQSGTFGSVHERDTDPPSQVAINHKFRPFREANREVSDALYKTHAVERGLFTEVLKKLEPPQPPTLVKKT